MKKLKIFSDTPYHDSNVPYTVMLHPFWATKGLRWEPNDAIYQDYKIQGNQFFEMVSLEDADYLVAPAAWEKSARARSLIQEMAKHASPQKPIITFFWHDSDENVPLENSIVFRTSFYKSKQKQHEFAMPAWSKDFLELYNNGQLVVRQKQEKPSVGFVGYAMSRQSEIYQNLKDVLRYIKDGIEATNQKREQRKYHIFRNKILSKIKTSKKLEKNFVIREQFHGRYTAEKQEEFQKEYYDNLINSDYIVCMRGSGNFSYRLYETLCCGRIPVFIDTDSVLPYDFLADWKQYCVWIDQSEINSIEDKILDFHNSLSNGQFVALQKKCREFWKDYLSPTGFFSHLYQHFDDKL